MVDKKQGEPAQGQQLPVNRFVKPNFNKGNFQMKNKGISSPKNLAFTPGTFKTQHKG